MHQRTAVIFFLFLLFAACNTQGNQQAANDSTTAAKQTPAADSVATLPDSFTVHIPIHFLNIDHQLQVLCTKNANDSLATLDEQGQDKYFPASFYNTLTGTIHYFYNYPSYASLYNAYKATRFTADYTGYEKFTEAQGSSKFITVTDINNDSIPEVIVENALESSGKNPMYVLFRWDKATMQFIKVPDFFKGSFYGWDSSHQYLVTGGGDGLNAVRKKNTVTGFNLKPVEEIRYREDKVVSRKKY